MFRSDEPFKPTSKTINVLMLDGGLGDHLAGLPVIKYITYSYPWIKVLLWTPDYLVNFAKHVLPKTVQIKGLGEMRGQYEPKRPTKTTKWDGYTSPMKIHLVDYAFLRLIDENPSLEHKNYLQITPDERETIGMPKNYAVITPAFTANVREFLGKEINILAKHLLSKGVTPVFLGQRETKTGTRSTITGNMADQVDYSLGLDLIDKTNLLQAANIMAGAKAVLGVDNGLLHLAGCTKVPIVSGFTTVSPHIRNPIRNNDLYHKIANITPDNTLGCTFCQERTNFLYGHDYRNCIYKDRLCVTQMTAQKFIQGYEGLVKD